MRATLPAQRHSALWAIFAPVCNRSDREGTERFLELEDRRGAPPASGWTRTPPSTASSPSWWRRRSRLTGRGASTRWSTCARLLRRLRETLAPYGLDDDSIAAIAIEQERASEAHKTCDWENNRDVQNQMKRSLDELFYQVEERRGVLIDASQLDVLIDQAIEIAKARSGGRVA